MGGERCMEAGEGGESTEGQSETHRRHREIAHQLRALSALIGDLNLVPAS